VFIAAARDASALNSACKLL